MSRLRPIQPHQVPSLLGPLARHCAVSKCIGGHVTLAVSRGLAQEVAAWGPALRLKAASRGLAMPSFQVVLTR